LRKNYLEYSVYRKFSSCVSENCRTFCPLRQHFSPRWCCLSTRAN